MIRVVTHATRFQDEGGDLLRLNKKLLGLHNIPYAKFNEFLRV